MKKIKLYLYIILFVHSLQLTAYHDYIFQVSVPKSGTYLLLKLVQMFVNKPNILGLHQAGDPNYIICNHYPPTPQNLEYYRGHDYRGLFIYRDPRDVVVSASHFTNRFRREKGKPEYPIDDLIEHFIHNKPNNPYPESRTFFEKDVNEMFRERLAWANFPNVYTTTFEKLVGIKGGGTLEEQMEEVKNILTHLKIDVTEEIIENACIKLHGRWTFHTGKIGGWKYEFSEKHKKLFKQYAGQLLIDLGYEKDFNW